MDASRRVCVGGAVSAWAMLSLGAVGALGQGALPEAPEVVARAAGGPRVLLLPSDTLANFNDVFARLSAAMPGVVWDAYNTSGGTPEVAYLMQFDAVLVWTNLAITDSTLLGDRLATYVDAGGGVVVGMYAFQVNDVSYTLRGRFYWEDYFCINFVQNFTHTGHATIGTRQQPNHPVLKDVTTFDGGVGSSRGEGGVVLRAERIADWSTGEVLVAERHDKNGRRIDLNFFPPVTGSGWVPTTDGAKLMANALLYVAQWDQVCKPVCGRTLLQRNPNYAAFPKVSNTQANAAPSAQRERANDFMLPGGGSIETVTVWGVNDNNNAFIYPGHRMKVNIWSNALGAPGVVLHTATTTVHPTPAGGSATGLSSPRKVFRFEIPLDEPFEALPGVTYWLSVVSDVEPATWYWLVEQAGGQCAYRAPGGAWTAESGEPAFALCGRCDCSCPGDANFDGVVNLDDLQVLLFNFGTVCP
ncbi:MAG: hypothetical protein KDA20_07740 [Phycisphaerales bacterium]|nr:hypothetical protein [Phycisphaerales bacterium]